MHRIVISILPATLALAALAAAGCGLGRPRPADRTVGREILKVTLDAWKDGATPDALQERDPPVTVADREWSNGKKLLDYTVADRDELFGADLRCTVFLTLDSGGRGQPRQKKATYSVGTNGTFTVVREDDD
jgi:hypothetical protein